jgi:archaemetzincin
MPRVTLRAIGDGVDVADVAERLRRACRLDVAVEGSLAVPADLFDRDRASWDAPRVLAGWTEADAPLTVLLCAGRGHAPGRSAVFGLASREARAAIVFTPRLEGARLAKEIVHELLHLVGLDHCDERSCVMSFSPDVRSIDEKELRPCARCRAALLSEEWRAAFP